MLRRLAAATALLVFGVALAAGALFVIDNLLLLVVVDVLLVLAVWSAWWLATRPGWRRVVGAVGAVASLAAVVALLVGRQVLWQIALLVGLVVLAGAAARLALGPTLQRIHGEPVTPARRPVMFFNRRSGGGKVDRFDLVSAAEQVGVEAVEFGPGRDLRTLAEQAVADGADMLAAAGGDGSQAIVAAVASEHGLPFACIPAGTRNHFALDLGLDRDDPRAALEVFEDAVETSIDLASVNGRVFVNNVSLGVYATVVQSPDYRDDKVGTFARMLPQLVGPDATPFDLACESPDGPIDAPELVMVSNNPYHFTTDADFGTRSSLEDGVLGIVVAQVESAQDAAALLRLAAIDHIDRYAGWREWTAPRFEVTSRSSTIEAGIDGEAEAIDAPLRFETLPGALRIRLPRHRPGRPVKVRFGLRTARALFAVARGDEPEPAVN